MHGLPFGTVLVGPGHRILRPNQRALTQSRCKRPHTPQPLPLVVLLSKPDADSATRRRSKRKTLLERGH